MTEKTSHQPPGSDGNEETNEIFCVNNKSHFQLCGSFRGFKTTTIKNTKSVFCGGGSTSDLHNHLKHHQKVPCEGAGKSTKAQPQTILSHNS